MKASPIIVSHHALEQAAELSPALGVAQIRRDVEEALAHGRVVKSLPRRHPVHGWRRLRSWHGERFVWSAGRVYTVRPRRHDVTGEPILMVLSVLAASSGFRLRRVDGGQAERREAAARA